MSNNEPFEHGTMAAIRPGKSCESSSSGKFEGSQCTQNSKIRDKGLTEIFVSNVGVA